MSETNRIFHVDGDSFFASCEIALDPKLEGRPVWVGGGRRGDGIVIAANRTAKKSGVKTGMACFEAARLCPQGVLCRPHYDEYRRLSQEMFRILEEYTPLLVPASIDEGFLDFTSMGKHVWREYAGFLNMPGGTVWLPSVTFPAWASAFWQRSSRPAYSSWIYRLLRKASNASSAWNRRYLLLQVPTLARICSFNARFASR